MYVGSSRKQRGFLLRGQFRTAGVFAIGVLQTEAKSFRSWPDELRENSSSMDRRQATFYFGLVCENQRLSVYWIYSWNDLIIDCPVIVFFGHIQAFVDSFVIDLLSRKMGIASIRERIARYYWEKVEGHVTFELGMTNNRRKEEKLAKKKAKSNGKSAYIVGKNMVRASSQED